ncbi:hypothetical protein Mapa_010576 [Marchantia paleacea]|nr:hypothetical protein Mapa_010576 [Marchantia paleacea]
MDDEQQFSSVGNASHGSPCSNLHGGTRQECGTTVKPNADPLPTVDILILLILSENLLTTLSPRVHDLEY